MISFIIKNVHDCIKVHSILVYYNNNSILNLIVHKSNVYQKMMEIADLYLDDLKDLYFLKWDIDFPLKVLI